MGNIKMGKNKNKKPGTAQSQESSPLPTLNRNKSAPVP